MYRKNSAGIFSVAMLRLAMLFVVSLMVTSSAVGQTARGEKSFGVKAGYISRNESGLAGLVFQYSFSRHVRIAPQVAVAFRHHNKDAFLVDVDMQFPFSLGTERASVYPIVGLAYNSWGTKYVSEEDVTTHTNSLGGNVGVGFEFRCMTSMKISLEGRYTLLRHNPNVQVAAGISYIF